MLKGIGKAIVRRLTMRIAMILYVIATIWDATMTIFGLHYTDVPEVGFVAGPAVELFGPVWGVIVAKSIAGVILLATYLVDRAYKRRGRTSPVPIVLTIGAILTVIGGSLWLLYY